MAARRKTPVEVIQAAKRGQTLCIKWGDAFSVDDWQDIDEIPDDIEPLECLTVGTLLAVSKTVVSVAHTVTDTGQFCGMLNIPLGWVQRAEIIR